MLTKEECIKALKTLHTMAWFETKDKNYVDENYSILVRLINQHFDNPPLKFEDLYDGMWVWDNKEKMLILLNIWVENDRKEIQYLKFGDDHYYWLVFEENRFYRYEVKEDE